MRSCVRKVEWISVEGKVPPGRREFMPAEVPLVTVEAGSPFRKIGEEVTGTLFSLYRWNKYV